MEIFIHHHLGLGDHYICNGLVRELCKKHKKDEMFLFTKEHNKITVKNMYSDIQNLSLFCINNDDEVVNIIRNKENVYSIGFYANGGFINYEIFRQQNKIGMTFDECFYNQVGLDFNTRWDSFKIIRNTDKELELFNKLGLEKNEYIFVHDDDSRKIDIKKLRKDVKIVTPVVGLTENALDYCYIIENALEIHCIDSSFKSLIESMDNIEIPLFFHMYSNQAYKSVATGYPNEWCLPSARKNWYRI